MSEQIEFIVASMEDGSFDASAVKAQPWVNGPDGLPPSEVPAEVASAFIGKFISYAEFKRWDAKRLQSAKRRTSDGNFLVKVGRKGTLVVSGFGQFPLSPYVGRAIDLFSAAAERNADGSLKISDNGELKLIPGDLPADHWLSQYVASKPVTKYDAEDARPASGKRGAIPALPAVNATLAFN